jgi:murein L,D-transpeptidase YcbB/YkuD
VRFPAIIAILTVAGAAQAASPQTPSTSATSKKAPSKSTSKTTPAKGAPAKSTVAKGSSVKSTIAKGSPVKSTATKTVRSKTAAVSNGAITKTAGSKSKKQPAPPRGPIAQQQPTVDRYREIQQALADKGYFSGTPDGNWGPESTEALKRFQREQNLEADGKIGALSLMALGLGPRRGTASAQAAGPPDLAIPVDPPPVAQPAP